MEGRWLSEELRGTVGVTDTEVRYYPSNQITGDLGQKA